MPRSIEEIASAYEKLPDAAQTRLREKWEADLLSNQRLTKQAHDQGHVKTAAQFAAASETIASLLRRIKPKKEY